MSDLKVFLRTQLDQRASTRSVDWTKRREKWLREVDNLFKWITSTLIDAGFERESIRHLEVSIFEERLGQYSAPAIDLVLPTGLTVRFRPIASVIVGGYGRVDVTGDSIERISKR